MYYKLIDTINKRIISMLSHSVVFHSLQPHGLWPARRLCPWGSPGKNTGVGCHSLLQGIFSTWGLNPGLLHCRWFLHYYVSPQGGPAYELREYIHLNQKNGKDQTFR